MNIKDFFAQKENPPDLYWTLVIEPGWVQAGAWYIKDGVAEVASIGPGAAWEGEEELLGATDAALSSCVQKLPEEFPEPSKTVFGVSSAWVEEGEIKAEYLAQIKKICTELSLTPTGFVVLPEAIAHLYKSEEGAPVNAVILGLGKEFLEISVFKLGNLVGTTQVGRSLSVVEDTIEGLSRFEGAAPLPSRIIVFDGKEGELEEAKNTLSGASWEENEKIKFLHTPKVELLTSERKILATSLAGAAEMGAATKVESTETSEESNVSEPKEGPSAAELGFAIGEDVTVSETKPEPAPVPVQPPQANTVAPVSQFPPTPSVMQKTKGILHGFYGKISSGVSSAPKLFSGKKLTPMLVILGVILVGIVLFWWFVPKATVSIYVSPKKFDKSFEISFDPEGGNSIGEAVVPGDLSEEEVSSEKTKSTSGTKLVGDKAKGSVKIGNSTSSIINLKAGSILVSSSDLRYTTDNEASISAALDSFNPGVANVGVTSSDIGAQYNLGNGEVFKVANYPKAEVSAQATSDFSGGNSREISSVSKEDQDSLRASLEEELLTKAKDQFNEKLKEGTILIDSFVSFEATDETFDHKIGDEAGTLKLSLTMTAKAVVVDRTKLADLVREKLKGEVPEGFVLRDTQIEYKFTYKDEVDGKFVFDVETSANFLPEIKESEIVKNISGRLPSVVQTYLSSIPGYTKATIFINPHFPGIFGTLPRVAKNISIEITSEK